jgi:heptosyltransferase I
MTRILLIKLTSLGDLIHALPALTDAYQLNPDCEFDWLIDENFQEIATWHPAVKTTFTTNHRSWRNSLRDLTTYSSIYHLVKSLRQKKYDLIIDGQGNFKTATFTFCTKGVKAGYDRRSVREPVAFLAYQKRYSISKTAHAIDRLRRLFACALEYSLPTTSPNFLIDQTKFKKPDFDLPAHYLVFVHNASWKTKLWPEEHWRELIQKTVERGYTILLPWGNAEEEARAKRLACCSQVRVLPRLSLSQVGYVLAKARASVCVDTGLSHLAAALNVPSITLYGSTDSGLIGASGNHQTHFQSTLACAPCYKKSCLYPCATLNPPCLAELHPDRIFAHLMKIIES